VPEDDQVSGELSRGILGFTTQKTTT